MSDSEFDVRELIALLSPKAIDLRHIPGGFSRITPQDIAARLSRCSRGASLLARAKYANDTASFSKLYFHFVALAAGPPDGPVWPKKLKPGTFTRLINLTVQENVSPGKCGWCNGSAKSLEIDGKVLVCSGCKGSGRVNYSDRLRARMMGIPESTFRRSLVPLHVKLMTIFSEWESEIMAAMMEQNPKVAHYRPTTNPDPEPPLAA